METRPSVDGKTIRRLIYPFLIYYGINLLVSVVAAIIITANVMGENMEALISGDVETIMYQALELVYRYALELQAVSVVVTLPVLIIYFRRDRQRRRAEGYVESLPDRSPLWMLLMVVFGAITAYAGNGMIALSGLNRVTDSYEEVAVVFYQGKLLLEIVSLGILTPVLEELIFRGLMYRQLTEIASKKTAVILAALMFGLFHGNFLQMVYGTALAFLMIYVYERFQTLIAPILFHIGANVMGILLSEVEALSFLYRTAAAMYISVILASLMIIGVVWLVENRKSMVEMHDSTQEN